MARNRVWATEESLWKDAALKGPTNERALLNYGSIELAAGNYPVAQDVLRRAESLNPHYPLLEVTLGILEGQLQHSAAAEEHFRRALIMRPNDVDTHFYYAEWLVRDGRAAAAISELQIAMRLNRSRPEPRNLLMKLFAASGDMASAHRLASETLSFDATNAEAAAVLAGAMPGALCRNYEECFAAGRMAIGDKRFLAAALANREAIRFAPPAADAWINLGWSLAQLGFDREADQAFVQALAFRPNDENARSNLEWLRGGKKE